MSEIYVRLAGYRILPRCPRVARSGVRNTCECYVAGELPQEARFLCRELCGSLSYRVGLIQLLQLGDRPIGLPNSFSRKA